MIRIILPCYNEAENLPAVFAQIAEALPGTAHIIYAVEDGSTDATQSVLGSLRQRHPTRVLLHPVNRGVAEAFRTGFTAAVREAEDDDVIALLEGDGTSTASLLPEMLRLVQNGADVVIASRYRPGGGYRRFPLKRLLLSRGANVVFRLFFPIPGVTDYSIFYRAYRIPPLRACMTNFGDRFIESATFLANAEILVKLAPYLRRVEEVPFLYDYGRKRGRSGMKVWKNLISYLTFVARAPRAVSRIPAPHNQIGDQPHETDLNPHHDEQNARVRDVPLEHQRTRQVREAQEKEQEAGHGKEAQRLEVRDDPHDESEERGKLLKKAAAESDRRTPRPWGVGDRHPADAEVVREGTERERGGEGKSVRQQMGKPFEDGTAKEAHAGIQVRDAFSREEGGERIDHDLARSAEERKGVIPTGARPDDHINTLGELLQ